MVDCRSHLAGLMKELQSAQKQIIDLKSEVAQAQLPLLTSKAETLPSGARLLAVQVDGMDAKSLQVLWPSGTPFILFQMSCFELAAIAALIGQFCGIVTVAGLAKCFVIRAVRQNLGYPRCASVLHSLVAISCDISCKRFLFKAILVLHLHAVTPETLLSSSQSNQPGCAGSRFSDTSRLGGSSSCLLDQLARCTKGQHGGSLQSSCHQSGLAGWQVYWRHS